MLAQPHAHHGGLEALLLEQEGVLGTSGGLTRTCRTAVQCRAEASATAAATWARAKRRRLRAQHEQASLHSCAPAIAHPLALQARNMCSPCRPTNMTTLVLPFFNSVFLGSPPSSMAHSSSNTAWRANTKRRGAELGVAGYHQWAGRFTLQSGLRRSLAAVQL